MREILFRGKRIDTEEWVIGRNILITKTGWCYICETGTSVLVHCDDYSENPQMIQALPYRIDENTCGQFSNIVDSKENKIFEDDIIKINFAISPMYGVVVFTNGGFYIKTAELGLLDLCATSSSRKIEMVGNIYDNPELVEVTQMTNYDRIKNNTTIEEMAEYFSSDALCMNDPNRCQKECTCKECWIEYLSRDTDIPKSPYKPCPFCGGDAEFYISQHENSDTTHWHKIKCQNPDCRAEIGDSLSGWSPDYDKQVEELKAKWNKRVGET